uniref:Helix-turn-helix domain-containing protein n=1 Tax=Roseihalotalea indica TaxID=2867963 RepID=A0AA49GNZ4_9BACT|nr:helix-turn-helix domain-containing protein [Tunicatimonas sp. TK19036]
MSSSSSQRINTIAAYHKFMDLPKPQHPLVSVLKFENITRKPSNCPTSIIHNFYTIALKKNFNGTLKYGQQEFDFNEGIMHYMSPRQVLTIEGTTGNFNHSGWLLLIHPDFLWSTSLAKKIKQYDFFDYKVSEALHLSDREESIVAGIMQNIAQEYSANIDPYSQNVIIAQIELLLAYSERFYQRQFITRKIANHQILTQLEGLLSEYFKSEDISMKGLPTVQYLADELHLSANYLSRLLKTLTGQSTRHFVQDRVIDLAKEKLSTTDLSVGQIAYELGFEHLQSFSKLFKTKTQMSPGKFRQSFN